MCECTLERTVLPVQAGASCGVVGRTGSGKSSLMLALFRLINVTSGRVLLDGLDVARIGLDALRRQLAIIPQVRMGMRLPALVADGCVRGMLHAGLTGTVSKKASMAIEVLRTVYLEEDVIAPGAQGFRYDNAMVVAGIV